jgi:hypothetical protein
VCVEKNALSGILYPITATWGVPFMVGAGFSSKTFLHDAAMEAVDAGKPTHIGYVGDHDPSGDHILKRMERDLKRYAKGEVDFHVVKLAVTPEQIEEYSLPTRPTKTKGNTHAKQWTGGDSVEVDALPMAALRTIVNDFIVDLINAEDTRVKNWHEAEEEQEAATEALETIIGHVGEGLYGQRFAITQI